MITNFVWCFIVQPGLPDPSHPTRFRTGPDRQISNIIVEFTHFKNGTLSKSSIDLDYGTYLRSK